MKHKNKPFYSDRHKETIWELVRTDNTAQETADKLRISVHELRAVLKRLFLVSSYEEMVRMVRQSQVNQMFSSLETTEAE